VRPHPRRILAAVWACLALAAAGLVSAPAANAVARDSAGPALPRACASAADSSSATSSAAARTTGHVHDVPSVSQATAEKLDRQARRRVLASTQPAGSTLAARADATLPDRVYIPVYAHVIRGTHASDRVLYRYGVDLALRILDESLHGEQAGQPEDPALVGNSRFGFYLRSVDYTRNDRWFHATQGDRYDTEMRRTLHRGTARALNLYFLGSQGTAGAIPLGWSTFPWQYARQPRLDGVSVNVDALQGGRLTHYNEDDTVVHEVGHWLDLYHTFQGGDRVTHTCSNDFVADTPGEYEPTDSAKVGCTAATCSGTPAQVNPAHDFMDYSYDSCMDMFTPGQVHRIDEMWIAYRMNAS
jgi:Pregnancy-associated plasma protein-A